jgi:hypothetical protein
MLGNPDKHFFGQRKDSGLLSHFPIDEISVKLLKFYQEHKSRMALQ